MCKEGLGRERNFGREEGRKNMRRQVDSKTTKQVRIDNYWHRLLKVRGAEAGKTIKELLEEALSEWWDVEKDNE